MNDRYIKEYLFDQRVQRLLIIFIHSIFNYNANKSNKRVYEHE